MRISLSISLSIGEICAAVGSSSQIKNITISSICTDTRELKYGDLYISLKGKKYDGNNFIDEARRIGAIILANVYDADILVESETIALLRLAAYYKSRLKNLIHTIAITGSVGKTTTKEYLYNLLKENYQTHKSAKNFNNLIGVSLSILSAPRNTEILILEVGMNHAGEISEISEYIKPTIGIITNVGTAHIGNLGSKENIARAKLEITKGLCGPLIVPYDEPLIREFGDIKFSFIEKNADIFLYEHSQTDGTMTYQIYADGSDTETSFSIGAKHLAGCAAPAICVLFAMNINISLYNQTFFSVFNENIRQTIVSVGDFFLLCDFYNASFESFKSGFDYISSLRGYSSKSALIGDVLELGDFSADIHRSIGEMAVDYNFNNIFLFGDNSMYTYEGAISKGFPSNRLFVNLKTELPQITAQDIWQHTSKNEIIYCKASNALRMDRILSSLKQYSMGEKI